MWSAAREEVWRAEENGQAEAEKERPEERPAGSSEEATQKGTEERPKKRTQARTQARTQEGCEERTETEESTTDWDEKMKTGVASTTNIKVISNSTATMRLRFTAMARESQHAHHAAATI